MQEGGALKILMDELHNAAALSCVAACFVEALPIMLCAAQCWAPDAGRQ